jgi:hypothetical protein
VEHLDEVYRRGSLHSPPPPLLLECILDKDEASQLFLHPGKEEEASRGRFWQIWRVYYQFDLSGRHEVHDYSVGVSWGIPVKPPTTIAGLFFFRIIMNQPGASTMYIVSGRSSQAYVYVVGIDQTLEVKKTKTIRLVLAACSLAFTGQD